MDLQSSKNLQSGSIAWMAGNSVTSNLVMVVLLVGGLLFAGRIKQEIFPEFNNDTVIISVAYPGASPAEVEDGIVLVIEESVQGLDGVNEVSASANEGSGSVTVEKIEGYDLQKLSQDIQREIDRITTFPEDAEEPQVTIFTHKRQVLSIVLYGDRNEHILRNTAELVRDTLMQDPNITQVELSAIRNPEISIEIAQDKLRTYNLTLQEIADKIRKSSVEIPSGGIKTDAGEILMRMQESHDYGVEFAKIPIISLNDGTELLVEDIATVIDGFEDSDIFATYNGKPAILIDVYRVGKQTPLTVADAVFKNIETLKPNLLPGLHLDTVNDRSIYFRQRIGLLLKNGYLGLILVFIILSIFLEARLAFWVTMGIPISFLGSMLFLPFFDISINMISLFAFIIALGIVVDDAIVVGENIYKHHQKGLPFLQAAIVGTREVAMPVIFSVLTNMVAFMPLYFVPGVMGKIFKTIPIVVISIFAISLIECLFVLPAHLGHHRDKARHGISGWIHNRQQRFSKWVTHMVKDGYGPFLELTLRNRYITISIGLFLLTLTAAYIQSGRMGMEMFPKIESDYALVTAVLPYGSSVKKTEAVQEQLLKAANEVIAQNGGNKLATGIFAEIGSGGGHITRLRIYLTPPDQRTLSTKDLVNKWREKAGDFIGLESIKYVSDSGGPGAGSALTIELSHRDLKVLEEASAELASELAYYPKAKDIDDGFSPGKSQLDFKLRPEGRSLNLTAVDIARQVRNSFYGAEVFRQQRDRDEIKVMVRLPKSERISEYNLEELLLRTPSGTEVPLAEAVEITRGRAYTTINRRNGRRVVSVSADVDPRKDAPQVLNSLLKDSMPKIIARHPGLNYGFEGRTADMAESTSSLISGLLLALMGIYALLAIPFKSYTQPLIIMVSIPFGIVGAILGHLLLGYGLSIMSLFGIVALSGIVVNDSLILIDFANKQRHLGLNSHDAVHSAGITRFRAIVLTTLTTFFGLSPMIMETSRQARYLIPMAISLGFGILFASLITLILVPSLYVILEDISDLLKAKDDSVDKF